MIETKFRVWHKEEGMSYLPVGINFNTNGSINGTAVFHSGLLTIKVIGNNAMKWMHYMGSKDRKNKEIYDGDFIQFKEGNIHLVEFPEDFLWCQTQQKEIKVIGNKFENPELWHSKEINE